MNRDELADYLGLFGDEILKRKTKKRRRHDGKVSKGHWPYFPIPPFGSVRSEYSSRLKGREGEFPIKTRACTTPVCSRKYNDENYRGPFKPTYSR